MSTAAAFSDSSSSNPSSSDTSSFWQRIRANVALQRDTPDIKPYPRHPDAPPPLSFAQARLWQVEQAQPDTTAHHLRAMWRLRGTLDVAALEKALRYVIERHESLRTCFRQVGNEARQIINPVASQVLNDIDLRALSTAQQEAEIARLAKAEAQEPFDLEHGPLLRLSLLHLSDDEAILIRAIHHMVNDRWSDSVFLRDLAQSYSAFLNQEIPKLTPLPVQYADFAIAQREHLQGERLAAQMDYWRQRLAGELPSLQLPLNFSSSLPSYQGATTYHALPDELIKALKQNFRQSLGSSLFTALLTGFLACLYRYFRQTDMLLATPVAGRYQPETRHLIGFFNNVLLLRHDLSGNPSLQTLLQRVDAEVTGAQKHQALPLQQVADTLKLPGAALSRMMFALQNVPARAKRMADVEIETLDFEEGIANFDLFLSLREDDGKFTAIARYKTALWQPDSIDALLQHYQATLQAMVDDPTQNLEALPALQAPELQTATTATQQVAYVAPRTATEQRVADIWQAVLNIEPIGIHTHFFEAGGRSLAAVDVCARLSEAFGREVLVAEVMTHPTVGGMAAHLSRLDPHNQQDKPDSHAGSRPPPNPAARQKAAIQRQRQRQQQRKRGANR